MLYLLLLPLIGLVQSTRSDASAGQQRARLESKGAVWFCVCSKVYVCLFSPVRSSVCLGLMKSGFWTSNVANNSERKHIMFTFWGQNVYIFMILNKYWIKIVCCMSISPVKWAGHKAPAKWVGHISPVKWVGHTVNPPAVGGSSSLGDFHKTLWSAGDCTYCLPQTWCLSNTHLQGQTERSN